MPTEVNDASRLRWTVRAAFTSYVLQDGEVNPPRPDGDVPSEFVFESAGPPQDDVLSFTGSVHWRAHGGLLDLRIADPRVDTQAMSLTVTVGTPPRTFPATIAVLTQGADSSTLHARLTAHGSQVFGGVYPTDSALDDLIIER